MAPRWSKEERNIPAIAKLYVYSMHKKYLQICENKTYQKWRLFKSNSYCMLIGYNTVRHNENEPVNICRTPKRSLHCRRIAIVIKAYAKVLLIGVFICGALIAWRDRFIRFSKDHIISSFRKVFQLELADSSRKHNFVDRIKRRFQLLLCW